MRKKFLAADENFGYRTQESQGVEKEDCSGNEQVGGERVLISLIPPVLLGPFPSSSPVDM